MCFLGFDYEFILWFFLMFYIEMVCWVDVKVKFWNVYCSK